MTTEERIAALQDARAALEKDATWSNVWRYLSADGGATPCSRYGSDGRECAVYALAACLMYADANGFPEGAEAVAVADGYMSAAVNDSDDLESFLEDGDDYTYTLEAELEAAADRFGIDL